MGSEWKWKKLGEIAKVQGGYAFKSSTFKESGIPVAKIKNIKHEVIDLTDSGFIDEKDLVTSQKHLVKNGDILISMTGSGLSAPNSIVGRVARHTGKDDAFLINQRVGRLLINQELVYPQYLYYVLRPKYRQYELVSIATGSANQVNISGSQIESLDILFPPLPQQRAIAHLLSTLDDKIALLRRQNETLEAMARALFKSWFVDFDPVIDRALAAGRALPAALDARVEKRRRALANPDYPTLPQEVLDLFPDELRFDEELGKWVPVGWEVVALEEIAEIIGGGTPSRKLEELYFTKNGIPWLSPKDLSGYSHKYIERGATDITKEGLKNSSARLLPEGTILFSSRAPIGYVAIAIDTVTTNQGFKSLVPKQHFYTDYLYHLMIDRTSDIESMAGGSTFKEISGGALKELQVLKPSDNTIDSFSDYTKTWNTKLENIRTQLQTLTTLRDTLLPKLISGELSVADFPGEWL